MATLVTSLPVVVVVGILPSSRDDGVASSICTFVSGCQTDSGVTVSAALAAHVRRWLLGLLLPFLPPSSLPSVGCSSCLLSFLYTLADGEAPVRTIFCTVFPRADTDVALFHVLLANILIAQSWAAGQS